MNTRQIQVIQTWSPNTGDTSLDTLCLKDFYHYSFDNGGGKVSYSLQSNGLDVLSDSVDIPSSIVQQWGPSDDIIFQYVATALGLTII